MKADQGELMVDPNGPWWFAVYLVCAVVLGGAYGLCIAGAPVWQVTLLVVMLLAAVSVLTKVFGCRYASCQMPRCCPTLA